jgi:hypothetical protein
VPASYDLEYKSRKQAEAQMKTVMYKNTLLDFQSWGIWNYAAPHVVWRMVKILKQTSFLMMEGVVFL